MGKIAYLCTSCGSVDIFNIHYHLWDIETQEWVLDSEDLVCTNCGSDDVIRHDIDERIDFMVPIVQYGMHLVDIYFSESYLKKMFNVDCSGLTIVFEKDTMTLYKIFTECDLDDMIGNRLFLEALRVLTGKEMNNE